MYQSDNKSSEFNAKNAITEYNSELSIVWF
jgi:hypothetical protein